MPTISSRLPFAALVSAVAFAAFACSPGLAKSEDWMFRRSYFSHTVPPELQPGFPQPESRSAYRPSFITRRGFAVESGYRYNRVVIRSGSSVDTEVIREGWVDFIP